MKRKGNVRRCLDDPAGLDARQHCANVKIILTLALEGFPDLPGSLGRCFQRYRPYRGFPCASSGYLLLRLGAIPGRQVFQFHSCAQGWFLLFLFFGGSLRYRLTIR